MERRQFEFWPGEIYPVDPVEVRINRRVSVKLLAFLLLVGANYMPGLDPNAIFAAPDVVVDEPVAESRSQEVARLVAPRGRTPEQADIDAVFSGRGYPGLTDLEPVGGHTVSFRPSRAGTPSRRRPGS